MTLREHASGTARNNNNDRLWTHGTSRWPALASALVSRLLDHLPIPDLCPFLACFILRCRTLVDLGGLVLPSCGKHSDNFKWPPSKDMLSVARLPAAISAQLSSISSEASRKLSQVGSAVHDYGLPRRPRWRTLENPFGLCGHASDAISRSDEIDEIWNRSSAKTS